MTISLGWRALFAALTVLAVIDLALVAFAIPRSYRADPSVSLRIAPMLRTFREALAQPQFRTYTLAVNFYRQTRALALPRHLKDQFDRAASSVALNLREGSAKSSRRDRLRYYEIALGSIRECQAVFDLTAASVDNARQLDALAASAYRLCAALRC